VTEEQLAHFFSDCGKIVDCRVCGDPNSAMRFAFIEFMELESVQIALQKAGSMLNGSMLRVLPSKTAIVPVDKELMPRTNQDLERCSRTVYAANIDKKVDKADVRAFFERLCGAWFAGGGEDCAAVCLHCCARDLGACMSVACCCLQWVRVCKAARCVRSSLLSTCLALLAAAAVAVAAAAMTPALTSSPHALAASPLPPSQLRSLTPTTPAPPPCRPHLSHAPAGRLCALHAHRVRGV
jgi:hypothetical protein